MQDALQESFVNVFRSIEQYDASKAEFHTWATRITINCALKLNKQMYRVESEELEESAQQLSHIPCVLEQMDDSELMIYLQRMPVDFLTVFSLHLVVGYSHKEISELLGIHESLSRKRLSRAKAWMRERLTEDGVPVSAMKNRI
jgi:RNA polymerase sigma-70 factor (ECF subfamily)